MYAAGLLGDFGTAQLRAIGKREYLGGPWTGMDPPRSVLQPHLKSTRADLVRPADAIGTIPSCHQRV